MAAIGRSRAVHIFHIYLGKDNEEERENHSMNIILHEAIQAFLGYHSSLLRPMDELVKTLPCTAALKALCV